jgi:hypothetical protein
MIRIRLIGISLSLFLLAVEFPIAYGDTVNIDFNNSASTTYSGTAAAPGSGTFWNGMTSTTLTNRGLRNSNGGITDVGYTISGTNILSFAGSTGVFEVSGGYAPLLRDYFYFSSGNDTVTATRTVTITNLVAGASYDLYIYGHGDQAGQNNGISINGDVRQTTVDGVANGDGLLAEDVEYVKYTGVVANGSGQIAFDWFNPTNTGPIDSSTGLADVESPNKQNGVLSAIQVVGTIPHVPLTVTIDTSTGEAVLSNPSAVYSVALDEYVLATTSGTLDKNAWSSLYDQGYDEQLPLLNADFNSDGAVDAADYTLWRDNEGAPAGTLDNDSVGGVIGDGQYQLWKQNFGATAAGAGWGESGGVGSNLLTEFYLGTPGDATSEIAPGESISLGNLFTGSNADPNLTLNYYDVGLGVMITGAVVFESGAASIAATVPEPSTVALILGMTALLSVTRRHRNLSTANLVAARSFLPSITHRRCPMRPLAVGSLFTLLIALSTTTNAALRNHYSFNYAAAGPGGIVDSVGGANGTLVDPAGTFATVRQGQIDLSANNNISSNQETPEDPTNFAQGAYIDLPNNLASSAFAAGAAGKGSLEFFFRADEQRNSARLFEFGTSRLGEDVARNGTVFESMYVTPFSGLVANRTARFYHTTRSAGTGFSSLNTVSQGGDPETFGQGPMETDRDYHVVVTFDSSDLTFPTGTIRFYFDGILGRAFAIRSGMGDVNGTGVTDITHTAERPENEVFGEIELDEFNFWLGRAISSDPLFDGFYDEFNVYDHALSEAEILSNLAAGPEVFNAPTLTVNRDTGEVTLINGTGLTQELSSLTIDSALGVFDSSQFLPPGAMETATATASQIMLADTNGTGADIPTDGSPVSLGAVWKRSPFEDLTASFVNEGSDFGDLIVEYVGTPLERSDLDFDGDIDLDDYEIFLTNSYTDVSGLTAVDAYVLGDINGDLTINGLDFRLFKADFLNANGAGAAASLAAYTPVPEPASILLLTLAASLISIRCRRR